MKIGLHGTNYKVHNNLIALMVLYPVSRYFVTKLHCIRCIFGVTEMSIYSWADRIDQMYSFLADS